MRRLAFPSLFLLPLSGFLACAPNPGDQVKPAGSEGGACYGNGTCDDGLSCLSATCVKLPAASDGGPTDDDGGTVVDASVPVEDSGSPVEDAGFSFVDGGSPAADAGPIFGDGGNIDTDAGGFADGGDAPTDGGSPDGSCSTGYHDGGDGVCVSDGSCSTGYHDGGDGVCVSDGSCSTGYHDGGDGTCVDDGTCLIGYHNGGNGTCVTEDTCANGYQINSTGDCERVVESTIPAGSFEREGSTVTITRDMAMMTREVTQGLWKEISGGTNPSNFTDCDGEGGDECPVEQVDWYAAVGFANALTAAKNAADGTNLMPCYTFTGCDSDDWQDGASPSCSVSFANTSDPLSCTGYRLPTEAEWEYAYRAGTTTDFYNGDMTDYNCDDPLLDAIGWYCGNANGTTHPVGQKLPNAWGLFDMAGNVLEWTWDWYETYPGTTSDYIGPQTGNGRVLRGGSWNGFADFARAAARGNLDPGGRYLNRGFRLTRTLP